MKTPVNPTVGGRFRLTLAYDGTDFSGWAKQPGQRTVQGELLIALARIFGEDAADFGIRVAGRTDAGVHADAQVVHVDLTSAQQRRIGRGGNVVGRLNSLLPSDIQVYDFEPAAEGFDARFSAISRRYIYRIADASSSKNPRLARYALYVNQALDVTAMHEASQALRGLHDFVSFCKSREGATTIRNLKKTAVRRVGGAKGLIEVELEADAFCHNMVRSIVGALIAVGAGKASVSDLERLLKATKRGVSYKTVEPHGLTLVEVGYPADSKLAAQAEKARNMRTLDEN
jgi:tRNA pseudouridine38-40 synthase